MTTVLFSILSAILLFVAAETSRLKSLSDVKEFIAPPPQIQHYSIGMRYQLSDVFWIRSLQDLDYCEKMLAKNSCRGQSWVFKMLEAVTNLDENYYMAYAVGGLALTVLVSDYEGASRIFDKGVRQFPDDWQLLYRAGYHVLYEEKNFLKAADLFKRAGEKGAPSWTISLGKRLDTKSGRLEVAERLLADLERRKEEQNLIESLKEKIAAIKAEPEEKQN